MGSYKPTRTVKTADTLFAVIESLQVLDGAGVTELAEYLETPKSTVHKHLATLEEKRYVINEGGEYRLSLKFLDHGMFAKREVVPLDIVRASLDRLAEDTSDIVWLVVEQHGQAVFLDKAVGDRGVQTYGRVGKHAPLHCTAGGKAILAHLPEETRTSILQREALVAVTDHTITDVERLRQELNAVRRTGVAFSDGEAVSGIRSVGGVITYDGRLLGAICVSAPSKRMGESRLRDELPSLLQATIEETELKLLYSDRE